MSLLARTNALLARAGFAHRPFGSLSELAGNASSMLVAVFEAIVGAQVEGIRVAPGATVAEGGSGEGPVADYEHNAQRVVDMLVAVLPPHVAIPQHVSGASIAAGDINAIGFVVSLLDDLSLLAEGEGDLALGVTSIASAGAAAAAATQEEAREDAAAAAREQRQPSTLEEAAARGSSSSEAPSEGSPRSAAPASAVPRAGSDIWSQSTPAKLRERSAVQAALLGGAGAVASAPPSPPKASGTSPRAAPAAAPVSAPRPPSGDSSWGGGATRSAAGDMPLRATLQRAGASGGSRSARTVGTAADALASGVAAELAALEERRRAAAAAMTVRRQQSVISRLSHADAEELAHMARMTTSAVRARESEFRVLEARALRSATARAKAAKHERKVLALRTRVTLEDMSRRTLSMRVERSSRQAAAAASLLKALSAQARASAAEALRAAAAEQTASLTSAQGRVAWLNHTARVLNEAVLEETARQVAQRQAATRSQKEALDRVLREMRVDEGAVLARFRADQEHAEAAFLATHVEAMDVRPGVGARGATLGPVDAAAVAAERLADATDTDHDPQRVLTLDRMHRAMGASELSRSARLAGHGRTIREGALDAGAALARGEAALAGDM